MCEGRGFDYFYSISGMHTHTNILAYHIYRENLRSYFDEESSCSENIISDLNFAFRVTTNMSSPGSLDHSSNLNIDAISQILEKWSLIERNQQLFTEKIAELNQENVKRTEEIATIARHSNMLETEDESTGDGRTELYTRTQRKFKKRYRSRSNSPTHTRKFKYLHTSKRRAHRLEPRSGLSQDQVQANQLSHTHGFSNAPTQMNRRLTAWTEACASPIDPHNSTQSNKCLMNQFSLTI